MNKLEEATRVDLTMLKTDPELCFAMLGEAYRLMNEDQRYEL